MYNAALVTTEQLKAVGVNAKLEVVDWPTSVNRMSKEAEGWHFFYTGWGTQPALGALATIKFFIPPGGTQAPTPPDPALEAAYAEMQNGADFAARQAGFVKAQKIVLEKVYAVPFGSLTKVQAVRSNVKGFKPFRAPRFSNVWIE